MDAVWDEAEESRGCSNPPIQYQFAETDDPRVLAVIERDDDASVSQEFDGDCFGSVYYREYRFGHTLEYQVGDDEPQIKSAYERARNELDTYERYSWNQRKIVRRGPWDSEAVCHRYMRIFWDTDYIDGITGGYDRNGDWVIFDTPDFRKRCGIEGGPNVKNIEGDAETLRKVLDGDVYGIGWAVNEARRLPDDEPIDLLDGNWTINIESWGYVGEEYAQREAFAFECGRPTLPEMLEVTA